NDIEAVTLVLKSPFITRGTNVEAFEDAIKNYCGAKYAVAFSSGTAALLAAGFAADINSHDRIITSPNTFIGTLAAGFQAGAEPIFIDIDRRSGNLDLEKLEQTAAYQSTRGRAIYLPVHFGGVLLDTVKLNCMIKDPEALIIEDAAHALGSIYQN